jgi:hypothetical protein
MASLRSDEIVKIFEDVYAKSKLNLNPLNPVIYSILLAARNERRKNQTSDIESHGLRLRLVDRLISSVQESRVESVIGSTRAPMKSTDICRTRQQDDERTRNAMKDRAKRLYEAKLYSEARTITYNSA